MERSSKGKQGRGGRKDEESGVECAFKGSQVNVRRLLPPGCAQGLLYIRRHASPFLISCASPLSLSRAANQRPPSLQTGKKVVIGTLQAIAMSSAGTRRWGALSSVVGCSHSKTAKAPLPPAACSDKPTAQHHPSTAFAWQEAVLHVKWPKLPPWRFSTGTRTRTWSLTLTMLTMHLSPCQARSVQASHIAVQQRYPAGTRVCK